MNAPPKKYAPGDDPDELICRYDWPEKTCREVFGKDHACGRADSGFRPWREIEPRRFAHLFAKARNKGGAH
jgi:hypothetical protein